MTFENYKDVKPIVCHILVLLACSSFHHLRFLLIQTDSLHVLFTLIHLYLNGGK